MTSNLDILLAELYSETDDHVGLPRHGRSRPRLTDAGLVRPAVPQVLLGLNSAHRCFRFAYC